jgi:PPOX class probable FMN-dependent enzyme
MDLFDSAIPDEAGLRELYELPSEVVARKQIDHLDEHCRRYLALCRFALVASADAQGRADVTPRGGPAGFISVLDEHTLAIPDATGNRRLDTFRNVVQTGRAGLLLLLPGRGQTLRINGRACVTADAYLLQQLTPVGKPPRAALVLKADEVFTHCPKAFVRSGLWEPRTWPAEDEQPSPAAMLRDHVGDPGFTLEQAEQAMIDAVTVRLA